MKSLALPSGCSCLSSRSLVLSFMAFASLVLMAEPMLAYNPPVDTAGPLTVRIEFPEVVDKVGVPVEGHVIIENRGKTPISGQLALEVIDRWKIEPDGSDAKGAVRFYVDAAPSDAAQGKTAKEKVKPNVTKIPFKATAGEGTYSGTDGGNAIYYPIHARATFMFEGQEKTAHPIHLLRTTFPWTSSVQQLSAAGEWKPLAIEADRRLCLLGESMHRTFVVLRDENKSPILKPIGFNGTDPQTGATSAIGRHAGAEWSGDAIAVHPPYRDGQVGTVVREYPVRLPKAGPIKLDFGVGVSDSEKGDGVTFRVRVASAAAPEGTLGEMVFERHSINKEGLDPCTADLSRFAGRDVRIQLEATPGPKWNTGWDSSYWGQLLLTAGSPTPERPFPPVDSKGFYRLGAIQSCGQPYAVQVRPGVRGLLDADVGFVNEEGQKLYFRGFQVQYTNKRIDSGETSVRLLDTTTRAGKGFYEVVHHFRGDHGPMDLTIRLQLKDETLQASFAQTHEKLKAAPAWTPIHLQDISTGPWSVKANQIYHGFGHVVRNPKAYRLPFEGHNQTTSYVGVDFDKAFSMVQAVDNVPISFNVQPEERHYSLHVPYCPTLTFIPTPNAFQGARRWREVNGLKASSGVAKAAGRFVFDLWGGYSYEHARKELEKAFHYGLTDSMVVWHNWQRWGYDYRLPEIYPPNPDLGAEKEMQALINACKAADVPFALHDNYIDFYPDAEDFSYEKQVAFLPNGRPKRAWLNEGRDALSYRYNPRSVMPFVEANLKLIRANLAPTAYFIDVWSSVGPTEEWTSDGQLVTHQETRKIWGEAFAWIRDYLGDNAPQISESGHDQLIGYLDGAQTNHTRIDMDKNKKFVIRIDCEDNERICWFDVAHHDRFILHGAGYSSRYAGELDMRSHGMYSDDYIATEVLTGHPGMVGSPFGYQVVRKYWLLSPLMRALALRTVEQVDFDGGPSGDLHRQHVTWSGGGQVWVNRGESDWQVEGRTLPQYGFLARVATKNGPVEASIERRDGLIVEQATSPEHLYFNARPIREPRLNAKLSVEKVEREGDRLKISMKAVVREKAPSGYQLFFHVNRDKGIVEQPAHDPLLFHREPGEYEFTVSSSLPKYVKPGDELLFTYGLWNPRTGHRYALVGHDDGTRRVRLGTFKVPEKGVGASTSHVAWLRDKGESLEVVRWRKRFNSKGRLVDFGVVVTNGGCRLTRDGKSIIVTPLPTNVTRASLESVRLQTIQVYASKLPWDLPRLVRIQCLDEDGACIAEHVISPEKSGDFIEIPYVPSAFACRVTPE